MHFKESKKYSIAEDTVRWQVLLLHRVRTPNSVANGEHYLSFKLRKIDSILIQPNQIRKTGCSYQEFETQKLWLTPFQAIIIHFSSPNGESWRQLEILFDGNWKFEHRLRARKTSCKKKRHIEHNRKFRPRVRARNNANHYWDRPAKEQGSNNRSEALA